MSRLLPVLLAFLLTTACSSGGTKNPGIDNLSVQRHHPFTISLKIIGERQPSVTLYGISAERVRTMVGEVIEETKVFRKIVEEDKADFLLTLDIFRVQSPAAFTEKLGNSEIGWTLTHRTTKTIMWRKSIETEYTLDRNAEPSRTRGPIDDVVNQSFLENIRKAIQELSKLRLPETYNVRRIEPSWRLIVLATQE